MVWKNDTINMVIMKMEKDVYKRLEDIFKDFFDDDTISINKDTTADDIDGWDSLEDVNLVCAIEEEFDIKFSMGETVSLKNIGEMVDLIIKKKKESKK